jgi:hypothetical protein
MKYIWIHAGNNPVTNHKNNPSGRSLLAQVVSLVGGTPVMRKSSDSLRMSTKSQWL